MTVYNWLTLFGVPGLFLALVGFIKVQLAQNKAIKEGLQAILTGDVFAVCRDTLPVLPEIWKSTMP